MSLHLSSRNHGQVVCKFIICINSDWGLLIFIYLQTVYQNSTNLGIYGRRSCGKLPYSQAHHNFYSMRYLCKMIFNLPHCGILRFQLKYSYYSRKKVTRKKKQRIIILPLQLMLPWLKHLLFLLSINLLCVPYIIIQITSGSFMKSLESYYPLIDLSPFQYFLRYAT